MIRSEAEIRKEIAKLNAYVERFKGDDRMLTWFQGQLKALYWVLGLPHMEAYVKSTTKKEINGAR